MEARLSLGVGEILWLVEAERRPRWSLGLGGDDWRRRSDPGAGGFAAEDPKTSSIGHVVWMGKNWVCDIMAKE